MRIIVATIGAIFGAVIGLMLFASIWFATIGSV
jgi:tetrahydromethanopterin S-methyltransferase subunit G